MKTFKSLTVAAILAFTFCLFASCGSMKVYHATDIQRTMEVTTDNEDLYVDVNTWMVETFNSAESVIQFSDKEAGIVMGRYYFGSVKAVCDNGREDRDGIYNIGRKHINAEGLYAIIKVQVRGNKVKLTIQPEAFAYPPTNCDDAVESVITNRVASISSSLDSYLRQNKNEFKI